MEVLYKILTQFVSTWS